MRHSTKAGNRLPLPERAVRFHRDGQYLNIEPAVPDLKNYFFAFRHLPMDDKSHGMRVRKIPDLLVWQDKDGRGTDYSQCYAGLEPLVREVLETAGIDVILAGERPAELTEPRLAKLGDFDPIDTTVLDLVRRNDRGLIRYDAQHVCPARLIAQVALAWPRAKIVVAVTRADHAGVLRKELSAHLAKVSLFTGRRHPTRGGRVVVATISQLGAGAIAIEHRDIYISVNPSELFAGFHDAGTEGIKRLWRARIYGLQADHVDVGPLERMWMTALFGITEVQVPRHGHKLVPTDVVLSRIFGGVRPPDQGQEEVIKRLGVWSHHVRNRRIARLFQILVRRDNRMLKKCFPEIARHMPGGINGRVGVLVENIEHGLALAELLDKVPVVAAKHVWKEWLGA